MIAMVYLMMTMTIYYLLWESTTIGLSKNQLRKHVAMLYVLLKYPTWLRTKFYSKGEDESLINKILKPSAQPTQRRSSAGTSQKYRFDNEGNLITGKPLFI